MSVNRLRMLTWVMTSNWIRTSKAKIEETES